jgi:hypothetical protein
LGELNVPIVPFEMAEAKTPVYPNSFLLGTLQSGALRVVKGIPIKVDRSDESFIATWAPSMSSATAKMPQTLSTTFVDL